MATEPEARTGLTEAAPAGNLSAALDYAGRGWAVLPLHTPRGQACDCHLAATCQSIGKHPRLQHGLSEASSDPDRIRQWWSWWPHANVGLAVRDGFVVVDLDGKEGADAIKAAGLEMPTTAVQMTGRGWHYLYRSLSRIAPTSGLLDHVDLRGPGSYIVAAPSLHANGRRYEWLVDLDAAVEAPPWLARRRAEHPGGTGDERLDMGAVLDGVPLGRRDSSLFRAACKLRQADVPIDMAISLLRGAAERCSPAFPVDRAEQKVRDAYRRYPSGAPPDTDSAVTLLGKDSVLVEFPEASFVFSDLAKQGASLTAEMEITSLLPATPTEPYCQRINLLSLSARDGCRRELDLVLGKEHKWGALLSRAASKAQQTFLAIDRGRLFDNLPDSEGLEYLVGGLVPADGMSILFGSGASGKTFVLYHLLFSVAHGLPWLGRPVERRNVLLLDWETGERVAKLRMRRIAAGLGLPPGPLGPVHYWDSEGVPLADQVDAIRRYCDRWEIGCLGLDHLAVACGGPATEQEVASAVFRGLGRIGLPTVALAHITGAARSDPTMAERPFGSVFWENEARCTLFLLRQAGPTPLESALGVYPRKINDGPRPDDFGAALSFEDPNGPIRLLPEAISGVNVLQQVRGSQHLAHAALGRPMTEEDLAVASGLSVRTLQRLLPAHPGLFTRVANGARGGRGNRNIWARVAADGDLDPDGGPAF